MKTPVHQEVTLDSIKLYNNLGHHLNNKVHFFKKLQRLIIENGVIYMKKQIYDEINLLQQDISEKRETCDEVNER